MTAVPDGLRAGRAIALLAVAIAAGATPAPGAKAVRLDGSVVEGRLVSATADTVTLGPASDRPEPIELPTAGLLSLDLTSPKSPPGDGRGPRPVVEFANGDRLAAEIASADEDAVVVRRAAGEPLTIPAEAIRGVLFRPVGPDDGFPLAILRPRGGDDLVALTNDDRLAGRFVGIDPVALTLEADSRPASVPRDRLAGLAFAPDLTAAAAFDGPGMIVQADDGWLTVTGLARRPDGTWRADTAFGAEATWPAGAVRRVLFVGGRRTRLADLEPASYRQTPFAGAAVPLRRNRDATGRPLAAGGVPSPTGLGTASGSRIEYRLDGNYARLHAVAGLSPSAGDIGSAVFAAEADGREVFRSGDVTAAVAVPVDLDLTGVETLTLVVEYGRNGDILDRANWCDAVLVKSQ